MHLPSLPCHSAIPTRKGVLVVTLIAAVASILRVHVIDQHDKNWWSRIETSPPQPPSEEPPHMLLVLKPPQSRVITPVRSVKTNNIIPAFYLHTPSCKLFFTVFENEHRNFEPPEHSSDEDDLMSFT